MKFRKFFAFTLMLGTIASNAFMSVEVAEIEFLGSGNYSIRSDRTTGNYYLKEKIDKGFEFTEICQKAHYFSGGMNGKVLLISA